MQTFIVRVWTPADGQPMTHGGLHGKVSHVETGQVSSFAGSDELLAFLAAARASEAEAEAAQ